MPSILQSVAGAVVMLAIGTATVAGAATPPNIFVTAGTQEPAIAIDPRAPNSVIIGANSRNPVGTTFPTTYYTSSDGGFRFTPHDAPLPAPYTGGADPSLSAVANGTIFFGYEGSTPSFCGGAPGSSAIMVTASSNRGRSFRRPTLVDVGANDDKPYMTAESMAHGLSHVFVTWNRETTGSAVLLARSANGGITFSAPLKLYTSSAINGGPFPLVGPEGHVYVLWESVRQAGFKAVGSGRIFLASSSDDGKHFAAGRAISPPFRVPPALMEPGDLRVPTFLSAGIGTGGRIYVAWPAVHRSFGGGVVQSDILVSSSSDEGESWTTPVAVNDTRAGDRFMPAVAVLADGSAGIAFYDRRGGSARLTVYAVHVQAGPTVRVSRNARVSAGSSPVSDIFEQAPSNSQCYFPGRFFGDYISAVRLPHRRMAVVWTDTQLHLPSETEIYLARVTLPAIHRG